MSINGGEHIQFEFLLRLFNHPHYIHIDGKAVLCFYAEQKNIDNVHDMVLRLRNMLTGHKDRHEIYMIKLVTKRTDMIDDFFDGHILHEPYYSRQPKGGGPSIFQDYDNEFNAEMFMNTNPDLDITASNAKLHFDSLTNEEKLFRTSQYKIYDKKMTWKLMESKYYPLKKSVMPSTFINLNTAPRVKDFIRQNNYSNYPEMMDLASGKVIHMMKHISSIV